MALSVWALDTQFLQARIQGGGIHAKDLRGTTIAPHPPSGLFQNRFDMMSFHAGQGLTRGSDITAVPFAWSAAPTYSSNSTSVSAPESMSSTTYTTVVPWYAGRYQMPPQW